MFFCFTGKFRDLLPVFFHDIHFQHPAFHIAEKTGTTGSPGKKKITVLCQITKFQAFLQVFLYISGHTHLRASAIFMLFLLMYHFFHSITLNMPWQEPGNGKAGKAAIFTGVFLGTNVRFLLDNRTDVCYTVLRNRTNVSIDFFIDLQKAGIRMLIGLHVKNLALIEQADVEFGNGLNILTGETGAGKSIIIGSVALALGAKASKDMIRRGEDYAYIELTFSVDDEKNVKN